MAPPKKLLDQVRETIRRKHYSRSTENAYVLWIKRFILFHPKRHPLEMGEPEIEAFLSSQAIQRNGPSRHTPHHGGESLEVICSLEERPVRPPNRLCGEEPVRCNRTGPTKVAAQTPTPTNPRTVPQPVQSPTARLLPAHQAGEGDLFAESLRFVQRAA